jgi:4-hydroxyphenylpyruvate dioxygenase
MNPRSIATVSLSGTLDEKLRAIAAAGFEEVEIFEADLLSFNGSPRDVSDLCAELNLGICAFQPFRDFEGMPEPQRSRNFAHAERKFALMHELRTDLMLICSNISPASQGGIDRAAADFRELGDLAAKYNIKVGYEALAWGAHVNDYRDAWEIVRRADHPNIGVILDSFHTLAPGFPVGRGAGTSAASPARAICPWSNSWRPCKPPAIAARGRWKSSTTSSAPARRCALPPMDCAR